ncbi:hypothetical protein DEU56DRAFT_483359 [Suillus clintonianus]|uniref:uncharacterized protein n=1 Tax=Suillus clintonianus TaxID=1904413 RepID=UPI001B879E6D|nr:uncharacterized protein DEU56DRAFT_483359 [Suillus clintonianus]KAG2153392.1 hypothetical protein DEU56DRAFT_483359 [Suillus clintonianus]
MSLQSAQCAVGTLGLTVPPDTPNLTSINGYGHYYTSPEPSQLLGAGGKDMPLNLSFEIAEDDEGIFISRAAAVWQGAISKRAMIPLPVRARAMATGIVRGHAVTNLADDPSSDDTSSMSHDMQICTDEVAQDTSSIFQSISATPGLRSWSFEELRTECYSQSRLATGYAPRAVPPGAPSWMIIPPAFNPYKAMT